MQPTDAENKRRAAANRFSRMTDNELDACLTSFQAERHANKAKYDPCLAEMARRKLVDQLQRQYDALMAKDRDQDGFRWHPDNLELLTALRRAQGRPDPLTLEMALDSRPPWRTKYSGPCLQAIVRNVDVGDEPVFFVDGCDDRGGRRERWRFALIDERGNQIADSNYAPMMGGGLGTFAPLKHGNTGTRVNFFELPKYVAPPPSGRYQLQAFYHNDIGIASERDISQLIVSKSEPLSVVVHNPTPRSDPQRRSDSRRPLTVLAGCAVLIMVSVISRMRRSDRKLLPISRRDSIWCVLLVSIAIGMWLDQRRQSKLIFDVRPDAAAEWSIRLADEAKP